ncbi:LysR family transcriptional regulator [Hydrocarboniphaga effusa]|jgi:LysR family carnitine catabolism transcriptional activator|uniref:LysR family transcriptional regulator n=1 Tax=Hydrocarboniphaga effusa TaxID=243629 RepID=UPI00313813EF
MTIRQLRAFICVAQTLSFARAGELLHLSQPALSLAIRGLEESLGGRLLSRTTRSVRLTPEGATLLPLALRLLAEWEGTTDRLRQRFTLQQGHVTVAAMPSFAANRLPELLTRFREAHPQIDVTIHDVINEQVLELVTSGRVEIGFCFEPETMQPYGFSSLFDDRFVAVVAASSPLAQKTSVSWKTLSAEPFITLQRPSTVRHLLEQSLAAAGHDFAPALECHQLSTVGSLVAAGLGVSAVPALCGDQMQRMGARCLRLSGPIVRRRVGLLTRRDAELSTAAHELMRVALGAIAERGSMPASSGR